MPGWLPALNRWIARWGLWRLLAVVALAGISVLALAARVSVSLAAGLAFALALLCGAGLLVAARWVEVHRREFYRTSTLDALTDLPHRRHFLRVAEREWALAERHGQALALALIEVDGLRRVNEAHGAGCGDALLQQVAAVLEASLRQGDVLARFGGKRFALLLPQTDPLGALDVAERMRERVAGLGWNWQGLPIALSITVGVGSRRPGAGSPDQLVADADAARARAKHNGGNCVRGDILAPAFNAP